MKKRIIIITLILLIFISLMTIYLYVYTELNKSLTCKKSYSYDNISIVETITLQFKKTKIDKTIGQFEMTFKDQSEANAYYGEYKNKRNLLIKGNKITYYTDETKNFKDVNRNRYQLKKNLEEPKLGYRCN